MKLDGADDDGGGGGFGVAAGHSSINGSHVPLQQGSIPPPQYAPAGRHATAPVSTPVFFEKSVTMITATMPILIPRTNLTPLLREERGTFFRVT